MAGTVTVTSYPVTTASTEKVLTCYRIDWLADAANGSVPATVIPGIAGYVRQWATKPATGAGAVAPTNNYTITLTDSYGSGADLLNGLFTANRSSAATQQNYLYPGPLLLGAITFNLSVNIVNSASGSVWLYIDEE